MKTELIIIENDADLAEATALVAALMETPGSGARLRAQAKLVEDYETRQWPRRAPSIPDLLNYLMEQHGMARADLIPLLGTASRVSEVLSGKSHLSMAMVRRLRQRFGISADLLIPPDRAAAAA
jgi:HTH-type transcriptional regulator/antitoxin HigA